MNAFRANNSKNNNSPCFQSSSWQHKMELQPTKRIGKNDASKLEQLTRLIL